MGKLHPNHRLVKIHRSYTVEEVAKLLGKHKNTVRNWTKNGLATIDDKCPMLIQGQELVEFLNKRRTKNKHPCKPGQIYCVKCRVPKRPAEDMAEYTPVTAKFGNLKAICPDCKSVINQRINSAKLHQIKEKIDITISEEQ
ncbi:MAG: helix-turn-helix domain-containing protein [Desulfobulbaceae bacterium]|jgi:hypothetical protein|nr:helix-turn-helix domain-containing protein [Desulfobulbaceae bacterium]